MTKAELIERIIDRITDPWTESCEDYEYAQLIDLDDAKDIIAQCREEDFDLEPEDQLPAEVTPELMMIAFNCNVRKNKHELRVRRLAEYITDNEMVCEYSNFYLPVLENGIDMLPVDFLSDTDGFPFLDHPSPLELLRIGANSIRTFRPADEFCWFDDKMKVLHSTSHPFRDGVLDADAFAEYIMSDEGRECFNYFIECIMDNDDIRTVFGCTREELSHE